MEGCTTTLFYKFVRLAGHGITPALRGRDRRIGKVEARLICEVSYRLAWATQRQHGKQRNPASESKSEEEVGDAINLNLNNVILSKA